MCILFYHRMFPRFTRICLCLLASLRASDHPEEQVVGAVLSARQLAAPGAAEVLVAVTAADHEDPPLARLLAARTEPREAGAAAVTRRGWPGLR